MKVTTTVFVLLASALAVSARSRCGSQVGGSRCPNFECCSIWGYCGDHDAEFCGDSTCQLDCWSGERPDGRCGPALGNPPCHRFRCCSINGRCSGPDYCSGANCQYRCGRGYSAPALLSNATAKSLRDVVTEALFEEMFPLRKQCPSQGFYSYHAFLVAAESFPAFATTGDVGTRKREIAAFLAHVSHATSGINIISTLFFHC